MDIQTFDKLVERETKRMKDVMCSKSADYADGTDKLFNFKLAAELDGISPIEALRGMWLKHRSSLRQALDELLGGKDCRPETWWVEKLTDDRNYSMLLQALLTEKYFAEDNTPKQVGEFTIRKAQDSGKGWYIVTNQGQGRISQFIHKDGMLYSSTGWNNSYAYGCAPGYYCDKKEAKLYIAVYKNKRFVVPEGWVIAYNNPSSYPICGWYVYKKDGNMMLWKDGLLHKDGYSGYRPYHKYAQSPGYWPTLAEAKAALQQYLGK